ncbi:MAG: ABC transporter ATP-binding protein [Thermoleophilia bacterium]|nr:ABC transporter ATP-binding protein [Thermoleophilia bacterium]MDH3724121.1 ABC transporter ATP-binding protein [Thermoleophilia bacterium]
MRFGRHSQDDSSPSNDDDTSGLIRFDGVSKTYTTGGISFTALKSADLLVGAGEFVGVVGPSGSGKSTLLNLMAGIDRPTEGRVVVDGVEVSALNENETARWRGKNVGVVFQFFQLLPTLSLAENVMLPMDFCGVHPRRQRPEFARELLDRVGLADQAEKLPSEVSGGQQQRAAIARALSNDPPIILGDEPTGNLDSESASTMMDLFDELVESDRTILMVTHDRELAERTRRIVEVKDGAVSERARVA